MPQETTTLCLSRKPGETIIFDTLGGERIVIEFKQRTKVAIKADKSVHVVRGELMNREEAA